MVKKAMMPRLVFLKEQRYSLYINDSALIRKILHTV